MNSRIFKHVGIWSLLMGVEFLAYIEKWNSLSFWLYSASNVMIALVSFYLCWHFGKRACNKISLERKWNILRFPEFWYGVLTIIAFVAIRLVTDLIIFGSSNGVIIFIYAIVLVRISYTYTILGFLFGMISNLKKNINSLFVEKKTLEASVETLQSKEIHLNSIIEEKERAIVQLSAKVEELQFKEEMLARDIVALEACSAKLEKTNTELLEQQAVLERSVVEQTTLQLAYKRDKEVTDKMFFQTNRDWLARVKRYQRILAFYNIPDDDGLLPGLN